MTFPSGILLLRPPLALPPFFVFLVSLCRCPPRWGLLHREPRLVPGLRQAIPSGCSGARVQRWFLGVVKDAWGKDKTFLGSRDRAHLAILHYFNGLTIIG